MFTPPSQEELAGLIRGYLDENRLATVATADASARPWASTVFFAYDGSWNFYFMSERTTRHAQNIAATGRAAMAANQARTPPMKVKGVQLEGEAAAVGEGELAGAYLAMVKRYPWVLAFLPLPRYADGNENRIYRISPLSVLYIDDTRFPRASRVELRVR